jgi:serine/threonine protein kinase
MEYADNGTLQNYLCDHFEKLTWNDKLNLAFQLANAISWLHDKEIVHRDLVGYLHFINLCFNLIYFIYVVY